MNASAVPPTRAAQWIADRDALEALAERIAVAPLVAMDTESNSMHAYRERTCTLQFTVEGFDALVDALAFTDLAPLRSAMDRPDLQVVVHGGDYDVAVLTRDHDWRFHRLFDTMVAATLLGEERLGLQALVEDHFGVRLDKRFQRADWAKRPLSPEQRLYLQRDTMFLPPLHDLLGERLAAAGLEEAMEIEMKRLALRRGHVAEVDANSWRRAKGSQRLGARGRAVLAALWQWREGVAAARDLPPFKVVAPATLVALATRADAQPPAGPRSALGLEALHPTERGRYGAAIAEAIGRGLETADRGEAPPQHAAPPPSASERARAVTHERHVDRFKLWRKREAEQRGVPTLVVLPNPAIDWLVDERPTSIDALATCPDIGIDRIARYGDKLVELAAGSAAAEIAPEIDAGDAPLE